VCGLTTCLAVATTLAIYNGGKDASKPAHTLAGAHTFGSMNLRNAALGLLLVSPLAIDAAQEFRSKPLPKMMPTTAVRQEFRSKHPSNMTTSVRQEFRSKPLPKMMPTTAVRQEFRSKHPSNMTTAVRQGFRSKHPSKMMPTTAVRQEFRRKHPSNMTTAVRFIIGNTPYTKMKRTCGGCMALHGLTQRLRDLGETVESILVHGKDSRGQNFSRDCARLKEEMDTKANTNATTVVVLPEMWMGRCRGAGLLHVHWILSPVGGLSRVHENFSSYYRPHDLVFNYGIASPGTAVPVPASNLLQIIMSPQTGDEFDRTRHPKLPRSGVIFTYRKAEVFHNAFPSVLHPQNATELTRSRSMEDTVRLFLTHKYFVCYDPYSYLAWIAPMVCRTRLEPHSLAGPARQVCYSHVLNLALDSWGALPSFIH